MYKRVSGCFYFCCTFSDLESVEL